MKRPMSEASTAAMAIPKKKRRRSFARRFKFTHKGETKSFYEWTVSFAELLFPYIGSKTYRVPPIYFNHQNVTYKGASAHDTAGSVKIPHVNSSLTTPQDANSSSSSANIINIIAPSAHAVNGEADIEVNNFSGSDEEPCSNGKSKLVSEGSTSSADVVLQDTRSPDHSNYPNPVSDISTDTKVAQQNTPDDTRSTARKERVRLLSPPQDTLARRDKSLSRVLDAIQYLGHELERQGMGGIFMVSGVSYENYLNRLPKRIAQNFEIPRPQDVATRGELDILILHPNAGIVLVQVKSVGENLLTWNASEAEAATAIKKVIIKTAGMTGRDEAVFKHILQDLDPMPTFTKVVALPFVSKSEFDKAMSHKDDLTSNCRLFLTDLKILSKDDLEDTVTRCSAESMVKHIPTPSEHTGGSHKSGMHKWWSQSIHKNTQRLCLDHQKTIAGRVCGLLSSMHVQPDSKSRVEVRTYGQAVSETADRTATPFLTEAQNTILERQDNFLAIVGPPGTGKTVILKQKGRQWLEQGRLVVVINFGPQAAGLPNGHALQEDMNSLLPKHQHARRLDLALCTRESIGEKLNSLISKLLSEICENNHADIAEENGRIDIAAESPKLHFIVDDALLLNKMKTVLNLLREHDVTHSVWCSTSGFTEKELQGYTLVTLHKVVRCPPTVQSLLSKLEMRDDWKDAYSVCSVDAGLATNGPPVIFLHHKQHRRGQEMGLETHNAVTDHKDPLQCDKCAEEVADILKGLMKESETPEYPPLGHSKKSSSDGPKSRSPGALQYKDILIAHPLPRRFVDDKLSMCTSQVELDAHWSRVNSSAFFCGLQKRDIPVKVANGEGAREIALRSDEKSVILTDAFFARSIERKVVIFVPLINSQRETQQHSNCVAEERSAHLKNKPQAESPEIGHVNAETLNVHNVNESIHAEDLITDEEPMDDVTEESSQLTEESGSPSNVQPQNLGQRQTLSVNADTTIPSILLSDRQAFEETDRPRLHPESISIKTTPDTPLVQEIVGTKAAIPKPKSPPSEKPGVHESKLSVASRQQDKETDPESLNVEGILKKLSPLNREALYRAAPCCVSQFVLIVPWQ